MSRKKLKDELVQLKEKYSSDDSEVTGIEFEDDSLSFTYEPDDTTFTLLCSDYPVITMYSEDGEPREFKGNLTDVVEKIINETKAKSGKSGGGKPNIRSSGGGIKNSGRRKLAQSGESQGSEEEYEDMDYDDEGSGKIDELLRKDIDLAKRKYGEDAISTRDYPGIDTMDVEIHVDASFLGDAISSAWKVDRFSPITVRLTVTPSIYLTATGAPKVEVLQTTRKNFGLSSQLTAIMTEFVKSQWQKKDTGIRSSAGLRSSKESISTSTPSKGGSAAQAAGKKGLMSTITGMFGKKGESMEVDDEWSGKLPPVSGRDKDIASIMEMGFSHEQAMNACRQKKSMEDAINLLLTDPDSCSNEATYKALQSSSSSSGPSPSSGSSSGNKRGSKRGRDSPSPVSNNPQASWETNEKSAEDAKTKVPLRDYGFLVQTLEYCRQRIPTLSNYCVICDRAHVFAGGAMLKPAVCSRELCVWSFQKLGVMSDAADDIATQAEVVDLLVCMATAAANSSRASDICDPYPTVMDPDDPKKAVFSPNNKDFPKICRTLQSFPTVQRMSQAQSCVDMKKELDKADKYAYPLLQWIISSNRSHLVKLEKKKMIKSMDTPFQYVLLSAPPEKEAAFNEAKEKHGSIFAFHGSRVENWHSILRNGLKNASGTRLQVNGAAYGAGIYLSPDSATSFGYSGITTGSRNNGSGERRFLSSSNFFCIALCEVVNHSSLRKSGSIWVMPDENYVITRFFFVYDPSNMNQRTMPSTNDSNFVAEVKAAFSRD